MHKKNIFVHIPKTGGVSIKNSLNKYLLKLNNSQAHIPYTEYVDWLGESAPEYYSFTFVRNPWDRLVSAFFFLKQKRKLHSGYSFSFFVKNYLSDFKDKHIYYFPQSYFIRSRQGLQFIGFFEFFARDFEVLCSHLDVDHQELPISNKSDHEHYTYYYDNETRDIVARLYYSDIKSFGYKFGK